MAGMADFGKNGSKSYQFRDSTRISLFEQFGEWRHQMELLGIKKDRDMAKFLLGLHKDIEEKIKKDAQTQTECFNFKLDVSLPENSTPAVQTKRRKITQRVSSDFDMESTFTACDDCSDHRVNEEEKTVFHIPHMAANLTTPQRFCSFETSTPLLTASNSKQKEINTFGNFNDVDMENTLTASEDNDNLYIEGEKSVVTDHTSGFDVDTLEKTFLEEEVYDTIIAENDGITEEHQEGECDKLPDEMSISYKDAILMEKCIVFTDNIMQLLQSVHGTKCNRSGCERMINYSKSYVGTCLVVSWRCSAGHFGGRWASQPTCDKIRAGNLLLASSLLLSGNSFTKVGLMFKFLNLKFFSYTLFNMYQNLYIAPAIDDYWTSLQSDECSSREGKDVVLSGDARNDSPGHCAQYCTYSLADIETKTILQLNVVDVREVEGRKSNNMERLGFERGMDALLNLSMNIKEVVTDGHTEIGALMKNSEKFKEIKHQRDVWHGGKGISKKIATAAKAKENKDLSLWLPAIRNHFWYCSMSCGGNVIDLKSCWIAILHHVVNEHEWLLAEGNGEARCAHGPLNEEERNKPWLKRNSTAHNSLRQIAMNKRFLNTLTYYTNFRHTGFLESFHNHLLMYAPKRHSYSYVGYKLRNQLAAIDFNKHAKREQATTADGQLRYRAQYSKRTKQWRPVSVLKPKQYVYIPDLQEAIFKKRCSVQGSLNQRVTWAPDDPRHISRNIAKTTRPAIRELCQNHKSRFAI